MDAAAELELAAMAFWAADVVASDLAEEDEEPKSNCRLSSPDGCGSSTDPGASLWWMMISFEASSMELQRERMAGFPGTGGRGGASAAVGTAAVIEGAVMAESRNVTERMVCNVVGEKSALRRPGRGLRCDILESSAGVLLLRGVRAIPSIESAAIECPKLEAWSTLRPAQQFTIFCFRTESPALPIMKLRTTKREGALGGAPPRMLWRWILIGSLLVKRETRTFSEWEYEVGVVLFRIEQAGLVIKGDYSGRVTDMDLLRCLRRSPVIVVGQCEC